MTTGPKPTVKPQGPTSMRQEMTPPPSLQRAPTMPPKNHARARPKGRRQEARRARMKQRTLQPEPPGG